MSGDQLSPAARAAKFGAAEGEGIVRCDACPVLCRIRPGRAGACARYANDAGQLVRTDPVVLMGDLNMPAPRPARITGYRSLADHPTFPLGQPNRQLDHILLRGSLGDVTSTSAPALSLSDHRALVAEVADRAG